MREPVPSTTTDSSTPASFSVAVLSIVAPAAMHRCPFVQGRKPRHLDLERVQSRREDGNRSLPLVVCHQCRRTAYQRRRTDADARTREDEALFVLDRAYESPRQPLRGTDSWQQDTSDSDQQQECPPGSRGGWRSFLNPHATPPERGQESPEGDAVQQASRDRRSASTQEAGKGHENFNRARLDV